MREVQITLFDDNPEYDNFVDKFTTKKTTDDCYTPKLVHEAVVKWVEQEYNLDRSIFLRPFWPDSDYDEIDYPTRCVVVDNPPFSIRKQIIDYYMERNILFFLYSPALTLLLPRLDVCCISTGVDITYENGATVRTSFVTNLEKGTVLRTAPALYQDLDKANKQNQKSTKAELPKYVYPNQVVTAAMAQRMCRYGINFKVNRGECHFIRALDSQRKCGKAIFGGGLLLAERAAAERAAAERAAAERAAAERAAAERAAAERAAAERFNVTAWELSNREKELLRNIGEEAGEDK